MKHGELVLSLHAGPNSHIDFASPPTAQQELPTWWHSAAELIASTRAWRVPTLGESCMGAGKREFECRACYLRPNVLPKAALRLFAFPYAGAGAVAFHSWASRLGPEIELVSMQYPGRGRLADRPPLRRMHDLVEETFKTVVALVDKPFWFFGHSMGAILAFELARRLRVRGCRLPRGLIVSAQAPPAVESVPRASHTYCDADLLADLKRYGGMRPEILANPDMLAFVLPLIRADLEALETWSYAPDAPFDAPIVALGGSTDSIVPSTRLEGWRQFTQSYFECTILGGGHFYIQERPREVIEIIRRVVLSL